MAPIVAIEFTDLECKVLQAERSGKGKRPAMRVLFTFPLPKNDDLAARVGEMGGQTLVFGPGMSQWTPAGDGPAVAARLGGGGPAGAPKPPPINYAAVGARTGGRPIEELIARRRQSRAEAASDRDVSRGSITRHVSRAVHTRRALESTTTIS